MRGTLRTWCVTLTLAENALTLLGQAGLRGEMACSKTHTPQSPSDAPRGIQGRKVSKHTFPKELPDLSTAPPWPPGFCAPKPPLPHPFCAAVFIPVSTHCPSWLWKLLPRAASPSLACPTLRASIPEGLCQAALDMTSGQCATCSRGACFPLWGIHRTGIHKPI